MDEDGFAVKGTGGGITGVAGKDGLGKGGVGGGSGSREVVVDERGEHLLVADVWLKVFVGSRTRVVDTADEFHAVSSGSGGKVRVLEKQFGIERGCSHLLAMEGLGIRPMFGFVLITIGGLVDPEEFALGDVLFLAENLAGC